MKHCLIFSFTNKAAELHFDMPWLFLFLLTMHVWFIKSSSSSKIFIFCLLTGHVIIISVATYVRIAIALFLDIEVSFSNLPVSLTIQTLINVHNISIIFGFCEYVGNPNISTFLNFHFSNLFSMLSLLWIDASAITTTFFLGKLWLNLSKNLITTSLLIFLFDI